MPLRRAELQYQTPLNSTNLQPDYQSYTKTNSQEQPESYTIHSLEPKPLKSYKTSSEYVEAMKEDLAEWLNQLYPDLDLDPQNFFEQLETGAIICRHANHVTRMGRKFASSQQEPNNNHRYNVDLHDHNNKSFSPIPNKMSRIPREFGSLSSSKSYHCLSNTDSSRRNSGLSSHNGDSSPFNKLNRGINWTKVRILPFKQDARPGTFFARDNICQFILWCRSLNIIDCLLFETDDLVARKNVRSFILCLLEVARIGCKVGVPTPLIIQLEQEIDREIENDAKLHEMLQGKQDYEKNSSNSDQNTEDGSELVEELEEVDQDEKDYGPKPQVITNDLVSLHEKVSLYLSCTLISRSELRCRSW